jgi:hypothetical protein
MASQSSSFKKASSFVKAGAVTAAFHEKCGKICTTRNKDGTLPGRILKINNINCAKITLPLFILMKVYYINQLT